MENIIMVKTMDKESASMVFILLKNKQHYLNKSLYNLMYHRQFIEIYHFVVFLSFEHLFDFIC